MEREEEKRRRFGDRTDEAIGERIEVHRLLGPGLGYFRRSTAASSAVNAAVPEA
jgi:hypothetical protein